MAGPSCPGGDRSVSFASPPRLHQTVVCTSCDATLEVVATHPLELDWAYTDDGVLADPAEGEA